MSGAQTKAAAHMVDAADMVAYLLADVAQGAIVRVQGAGSEDPITTQEAIPVFHKIALRGIGAGETIWRGGWPIGRATADIAAGAHVHTHNLFSSYSTTLKETE